MYHRVTKEERRLVYFMRQEGDGIRMIARRLGRSASKGVSPIIYNFRPSPPHFPRFQPPRPSNPVQRPFFRISR